MNVPLVYLCAFSLFLSLTLFFYNKGYKGANRFLSGYLFCSSAFLLTQYFLVYSKSISLIAFFITELPSLFYLIGPFAYFYVRSILRDNVKLTKTDNLHFLPFVIIFIGAIPFLFSSWEYKCFIAQKIVYGTFMGSKYNINFIVPKVINQLIRPPFALFYLVLISREFFRNIDIFKSFSHAKVVKIWLGLFFMVFSVVVVFYIIVQFTFYLKIKFLFDNLWVYYLLNSIAFVYLVFNFSLILFPQILYGLPNPKTTTSILLESSVASLENSVPISTNKKSIFNPLISEEYKKEIELKINKWRTEQRFLETDASILTLASLSGIPIHHISYYFNTFLKIKYTDWCNTLRIEYAKEQIDSGFNKNITLLAISELSGFSSQSTFIRSFKNIVGCTPSDYIKTKQR